MAARYLRCGRAGRRNAWIVALAAFLVALGGSAGAPPANAQTRPSFHLPFQNGQKWKAGAPHTDTASNRGNRGSLDFGPVGSNKKVVAIAAGTVFVKSCSGGKYVGVDHGNGWKSTYYHLARPQTQLAGKRVLAGTYLGDAARAVPCGGSADFDHVHLSIWKDGAAANISGFTFGNYRTYSTGTDYYGYWNDRSGNRVLDVYGLAKYGLTSSTPAPRPAASVTPRTLAERSTATGDFNNDGYDDVAIGVPGEDLSGRKDVGLVNIAYGTPSGFRKGPFVAQSRPGREDGILTGGRETGDYVGAAVAVGDFNNDGYDDIAVGAPGEDLSGRKDVGLVNIAYGTATGFRKGPFLTQSPPGTDDGVLEGGRETGDYVGAALAVGDFNNDGYDDIAVGAPGEDLSGRKDVGAVNIAYGTATGFRKGPFVAQSQPRSEDGVLEGGRETGDYVGAALAVGDFNNDGYEDIAVSAPGEDLSDRKDTGAVNIAYSTRTGFRRGPSLSQSPAGSSWGLLDGARETGDNVGVTLAVGDFNNDGYDDVAVGVPGEDIGNAKDVGAINIAYATTTGFRKGPGLSQSAPGSTSGLLDGARESGDYIGTSLAVGDFNNDGYDDVAVGVPGEDIGNAKDVGAINIAYATTTGFRKGPGLSQSASGRTNGLLGGTRETGDYIGATLAVGNFNNDGYDDMAVGVPGEDLSGRKDAGAVNSANGTPSGFRRGPSLTQSPPGTSTGLLSGGRETGDNVGGGSPTSSWH